MPPGEDCEVRHHASHNTPPKYSHLWYNFQTPQTLPKIHLALGASSASTLTSLLLGMRNEHKIRRLDCVQEGNIEGGHVRETSATLPLWDCKLQYCLVQATAWTSCLDSHSTEKIVRIQNHVKVCKQYSRLTLECRHLIFKLPCFSPLEKC
jgi:hypothetical protein